MNYSPLDSYRKAVNLLKSTERFMKDLPSSDLKLREVFARDRVMTDIKKLVDDLKGPALSECMTLVGSDFTDAHGYLFVVTSIDKDLKVSLTYDKEKLTITLAKFLDTIIHLNGYSPLADYENCQDRVE